jgi:hypothetical protein
LTIIFTITMSGLIIINVVFDLHVNLKWRFTLNLIRKGLIHRRSSTKAKHPRQSHRYYLIHSNVFILFRKKRQNPSRKIMLLVKPHRLVAIKAIRINKNLNYGQKKKIKNLIFYWRNTDQTFNFLAHFSKKRAKIS